MLLYSYTVSWEFTPELYDFTRDRVPKVHEIPHESYLRGFQAMKAYLIHHPQDSIADVIWTGKIGHWELIGKLRQLFGIVISELRTQHAQIITKARELAERMEFERNVLDNFHEIMDDFMENVLIPGLTELMKLLESPIGDSMVYEIANEVHGKRSRGIK